MAEKTKVAWAGAAGSLAITLFLQADRIAKLFGIINIPKDARELMTTLSAAPIFLSVGVLAIGGACVVYLYLDHLTALKRRVWNPKLDLLTIGLIGLVVSAGITGFALYRQPRAIASPPEQNPLIRNVAGPPIEWRFDKPVTIFIYSRRPGEGVWLDAVMIHATNKTDKPLKNVRASIIPDMTDQKIPMRVNPHGVFTPPEESAKLIPPRADFDLTVAIPSKSERKQGLPAEQFLADYGGLKFLFEYDDGASFSWEFPLAYLEDQITFIEERTKEHRRLPASLDKKSERNLEDQKTTTGPTSAGIELASIGLTPPKNVAITDEVVVESMAITFFNISNSDGKETLFRRSWTPLSTGHGLDRRISFHKFYVAIENKSKTKTLRNARLVMEAIKGAGGSVMNDALLCDRTETGSADIPPGGHDYFLLGEGVDDSDAGMFHHRLVDVNEYARLMDHVDQLEQKHARFLLHDSKGKRYSLLKNDGYRIQVSAYADDTPPVEALLILNTRNRIELWLTGNMNA